MPEGPTAQEIWAEDVVKVAFQTAWNDSFPNRQTCREEGGWIYAVSQNRQWVNFEIRRATAGHSDSQTNPVSAAMGIDLGSPPQVPDHTLVGNFHTHPLSSAHLGNSHPSRNDLLNAYDRQVPGIIVGRDGMIKYGDARRDMTNPGGYPPKPSRAQEGAYPTRKIGPRPNAAPNDVNPHDN